MEHTRNTLMSSRLRYRLATSSVSFALRAAKPTSMIRTRIIIFSMTMDTSMGSLLKTIPQMLKIIPLYRVGLQ